MNYLSVIWLLSLSLVASASVEMPIEPYPATLLESTNKSLAVAGASLPQLRLIVERFEHSEQRAAAEALIARGDEATIARLVFAFRRGNALAEGILLSSASVSVVPYLLEDVAHGSLDHYCGGGHPAIGRVRVTASAIVVAALSRTQNLPAETAEWLDDLRRYYAGRYDHVPELSKTLLDWWSHNGEAMLGNRPNEAAWLPLERKLDPMIFESWRRVNDAKPPPPPPAAPPLPREPLSALPLLIAESFENWASRVVEAKQRDVTWASVDFETGRSVRLNAHANDASDPSDKPLSRGTTQKGSPCQESSKKIHGPR